MNNIATKYNNNKQVKELFRQQAKKKKFNYERNSREEKYAATTVKQ